MMVVDVKTRPHCYHFSVYTNSKLCCTSETNVGHLYLNKKKKD